MKGRQLRVTGALGGTLRPTTDLLRRPPSACRRSNDQSEHPTPWRLKRIATTRRHVDNDPDSTAG